MTLPDTPRGALRRQRTKKRRITFAAALAVAVLIAVAVVVLLPGSKLPVPKASLPETAASHGTSPVPTTTVPGAGLAALRTPTATDPLRVLEIGDSLGEDLGFQMQDDLPATGVATIAMDSRGDTGLANLDYYDWPTALQTDIEQSHPEIVVIFLGANDGQGFDVNGVPADFGTPTWISAYTQRVDELLAECHHAGARVVWVGMPPMEDTALNSEMQQIDSIFAAQVARYPGAIYVPSATVLAPAGTFTSDLTNSDGLTEEIRTPDGVHLTASGAELVSQEVIAAIDSEWHLTLKT